MPGRTIQDTYESIGAQYADREFISDIFQKYLKRSPDDQDYINHFGKIKESLINEILACREYALITSVEKVKPINIPSEKIKVAICVSGHVRRNEFGSTFRKKFEYLSSKYDIRIFAHSWLNLGIKGTEMSTGVENLREKAQVFNQLHLIPNVAKVKIEDNTKFINDNNVRYKNQPVVNWSSPEVYIKSQLYSVNQSFKLLEEYMAENNYMPDVVLKVRFDAHILSLEFQDWVIDEIKNLPILFVTQSGVHGHSFQPKMPRENGCLLCEDMYKRRVFHPHPMIHPTIFCDYYAYGSYEAMKAYCSLYEKYDEIVEKTTVVNNQIIDKFREMAKSGKTKYKEFIEGLDRRHLGGEGEPGCCTNVNDVYHLSHDVTAFCLYPTYPESMLRFVLQDYLVVASKSDVINIGFRR